MMLLFGSVVHKPSSRVLVPYAAWQRFPLSSWCPTTDYGFGLHPSAFSQWFHPAGSVSVSSGVGDVSCIPNPTAK